MVPRLKETSTDENTVVNSDLSATDRPRYSDIFAIR